MDYFEIRLSRRMLVLPLLWLIHFAVSDSLVSNIQEFQHQKYLYNKRIQKSQISQISNRNEQNLTCNERIVHCTTKLELIATTNSTNKSINTNNTVNTHTKLTQFDTMFLSETKRLNSRNIFFVDDFNEKIEFIDKNMVCSSAHLDHKLCKQIFITTVENSGNLHSYFTLCVSICIIYYQSEFFLCVLF